MSEPRLAPAIEASAFLRRAEADGGFAMLLHKGDSERGTLLVSIAERGEPVACLAREWSSNGYAWRRVGPDPAESVKLAQFLEKRRSNDPDEWQIELDIPFAQRLIAEMTSAG